MTSTTNDILEMLNDDIVSHGFFAQCLAPDPAERRGIVFDLKMRDQLAELLSSGKVEIGETKVPRPDYVEFVAWRGTIDARVARAMNAVDTASGPDKEFAYWLCLRENVDRFEGENPTNPDQGG